MEFLFCSTFFKSGFKSGFIIKSIQNIIEKEDLLSKLILLSPNDSNLYYMMGEMFKKTNPLKALTWYKICHQIDPNNKSNKKETKKQNQGFKIIVLINNTH